LVLLKRHWKVSNVKVFCYREAAGKGDISKTIVLDIDMSEADFSGYFRFKLFDLVLLINPFLLLRR